MALILNGADVERASNMKRIIDSIEEALKEEAAGNVVQPPRVNIGTQEGFFRVGAAVLGRSKISGYKVFNGEPRKTGVRYMIAVYEQEGRLLALMDAYYLTAARTGATTGIATKYMARKDSKTVGVIGSGLEGRTNLEAVCAVQAIETVRVFSPNPKNRQAYAEEMSSKLGVEIIPADSPQACVAGADIVIVGTNTFGKPDPIAFRGDWMEPGMHVNSIGSTMPQLREVDTKTFGRAARITVDTKVGAEQESGDIIEAIKDGSYVGDEIAELHEVVAGQKIGRGSDSEITVFKSVGTALQDVIAGYAVYLEAREQGLGTNVGEFLEPKFF